MRTGQPFCLKPWTDNSRTSLPAIETQPFEVIPHQKGSGAKPQVLLNPAAMKQAQLRIDHLFVQSPVHVVLMLHLVNFKLYCCFPLSAGR